MAYRSKKGWYKLVNQQKFIKPSDAHMGSFNESTYAVQYKSGLEQKSFKYADSNPGIVKWSVEPFAIKYIKPTDGKVHRYYIDLFLEFASGAKFLVEVKSSGETRAPTKPKTVTKKSEYRYRKALQTWAINSAKWEAARVFCKEKGLKFVFLTERELG